MNIMRVCSVKCAFAHQGICNRRINLLYKSRQLIRSIRSNDTTADKNVWTL